MTEEEFRNGSKHTVWQRSATTWLNAGSYGTEELANSKAADLRAVGHVVSVRAWGEMPPKLGSVG